MKSVKTDRHRRFARLALPLALGWMLSGCMTLGPDHERPLQLLPDRFVNGQAASNSAPVLEIEWWRRFNDPLLTALVEKALNYNTDVVAAMARIDEADAAYDEAVGGSFPRIDLQGQGQRARAPFILSPTGFAISKGVGVSAAASYEIDFWGRMKRTREAARAGAVGSRYAADVTRVSIAAGVTQSFINLRSLDEQIRLAERTVRARDEQLKLIRVQFEGGAASSLDYQQARGLRSDAIVQLRELQRQRGLAQNQIALLTGEPGAVTPVDAGEDPLSRLPLPPVPPAGLPSALLERRPDIRLAEENLIAANAQIGIAKAAMLPSISLTGGVGGQSQTLASLFDASNRIWNLGFGLSLPIFNAGALAARTAQAEARKRQLIAAYQGSIQSAFQEVSNALVSASAAQVSEVDVIERADAAKEAASLARMRYEGGYSSYLELLDAERTLFAAQQQLILNRQARLGYAVDLYRAMAGGWADSADATVAGDIESLNAAAAGSSATIRPAANSPGQKRAQQRSQRSTGRLQTQQQRLPAARQSKTRATSAVAKRPTGKRPATAQTVQGVQAKR